MSSRVATGNRRWTAGARSPGACAHSRRNSGASRRPSTRSPPSAGSAGRRRGRRRCAARARMRMRTGVRTLLERLEAPVVAVATAEHALVDSALRPVDGAFAAVVCARGARGALRAALARADAPADRVVHVGRDPRSCAPRPRSGCASSRPRSCRGSPSASPSPRRHDARTPAGVRHRGAGARVARPHPEQRDPAGHAVARARARPQLRRPRPTVREALQLLVHQGLLQRRPNHTASVPELTSDAVGDIFFARAPIELHAVRTLAARREDVPGSARRRRALPGVGRRRRLERRRRGRHGLPPSAHGCGRLAAACTPLRGARGRDQALHRAAPSGVAHAVGPGRGASSGPGRHPRRRGAAAVARMREHLDKAVRDLTGRARELGLDD